MQLEYCNEDAGTCTEEICDPYFNTGCVPAVCTSACTISIPKVVGLVVVALIVLAIIKAVVDQNDSHRVQPAGPAVVYSPGSAPTRQAASRATTSYPARATAGFQTTQTMMGRTTITFGPTPLGITFEDSGNPLGPLQVKRVDRTVCSANAPAKPGWIVTSVRCLCAGLSFSQISQGRSLQRRCAEPSGGGLNRPTAPT